MRLRERSYGINTVKKFKILLDHNITKDPSQKKENYEQLEEIASSYFTKKEPQSFEPNYNIPLHPPKIENKKRDYSSRGKPIKFHENAFIAKLNPSDIGEINSSQRQVNFLNLMAMFDENEIEEMNIEELLGVDLEKLGYMKQKLNKIINFVNKANGEKNDAIKILKEKSKQIDKNIEDIKDVETNVENIDKIIFGEKETKVKVRLRLESAQASRSFSDS